MARRCASSARRAERSASSPSRPSPAPRGHRSSRGTRFVSCATRPRTSPPGSRRSRAPGRACCSRCTSSPRTRWGRASPSCSPRRRALACACACCATSSAGSARRRAASFGAWPRRAWRSEPSTRRGSTAPFGWLGRDHRKCIVVDGRVGFVTGLCVAERWAGDPARGRGPWRDTGVEVRGPAVADLARAFADAWDEVGPAIAPDELPRREAIPAAGDVALRVVATVPSTSALYRVDHLVAAIARRTLWITDAYYVGTASYVQALRAAAKDGVDVRLLVPGESDLGVVKRLSIAGYRPLLEAGVRIFEWNGSMLHAKTAVADGRWARVGSSNLNLSSWLANWELDVAVEDERFAREMERVYEEDLDAGDGDRARAPARASRGCHATPAPASARRAARERDRRSPRPARSASGTPSAPRSAAIACSARPRWACSWARRSRSWRSRRWRSCGLASPRRRPRSCSCGSRSRSSRRRGSSGARTGSGRGAAGRPRPPRRRPRLGRRRPRTLPPAPHRRRPKLRRRRRRGRAPAPGVRASALRGGSQRRYAPTRSTRLAAVALFTFRERCAARTFARCWPV